MAVLSSLKVIFFRMRSHKNNNKISREIGPDILPPKLMLLLRLEGGPGWVGVGWPEYFHVIMKYFSADISATLPEFECSVLGRL